MTNKTKAMHTERYLMAIFMALAIAFAFPVSLLSQEIEVKVEEDDEEDPWADHEFAYEDEVLLDFFDINREISKMRQETQEEIAKVADEHGLSMERFQQIANAAQIGQLGGGNFTDEEVEAFNNVAPLVTQLQRQMQQEAQEIITEGDLSMEKYREILGSFREDTELQEYVTYLARERARQEILEERKEEARRKLEEEKKKEEEEEEEEEGEEGN